MKTKYHPAPNVTTPRHNTTSGQLYGVTTRDNEEVVWHVTYMPDGSQVVTGYTIKSKPTKKKRNG